MSFEPKSFSWWEMHWNLSYCIGNLLHFSFKVSLLSSSQIYRFITGSTVCDKRRQRAVALQLPRTRANVVYRYEVAVNVYLVIISRQALETNMKDFDINDRQNYQNSHRHRSILLELRLPRKLLGSPFEIFGLGSQFLTDIADMV